MRLLALLLSLSLPALAATPPGSASAAIEASNNRVRAALQRYSKATGPARQKGRADARDAVGSLLDFQAIAQATMGRHWSELKAEQRVKYVNALRGAMEANYLSKMKQGSVDISKVRNEILGETKQGDKTIVKTRIVTGKDNAEVDYVMERGKKGWKAVDIVTEGVSLVDTYREQVNKLLPKKGVDGVIDALDRARKRLEAEEDKPTTAQDSAPAKDSAAPAQDSAPAKDSVAPAQDSAPAQEAAPAQK